jgi:hypothetical protein
MWQGTRSFGSWGSSYVTAARVKQARRDEACRKARMRVMIFPRMMVTCLKLRYDR